MLKVAIESDQYVSLDPPEAKVEVVDYGILLVAARESFSLSGLVVVDREVTMS